MSELIECHYLICGILTNSAERQPTRESTNGWPNYTSDRTDLCTKGHLSKRCEKRELTCCAVFCQFRAIGHLLDILLGGLVEKAARSEGFLEELSVRCYSLKCRHVNGWMLEQTPKRLNQRTRDA